MGVEFLLLLLILAGGVIAVRLPGPAGRRARSVMLVGLIACVGGCVGMVGWLNAETSGAESLFSEVNPYLSASVTGAGLLILALGAILALAGRAKQRHSET